MESLAALSPAAGALALPRHLVVLGDGAEACATAQAYRRRGADVTLIARGRLLPREDRPGAAKIRAALLEDGVGLAAGIRDPVPHPPLNP